MSLFGDLDIQSASDDPFDIPPDKYQATVSNVEVKANYVSKNRPDAVPTTYLVIEYTITDGYHETAIGQTLQDWLRVPTSDADNRGKQSGAQAKSWIKLRMLGLGIPESRINQVGPDDLVGIDVYVDVSKGKGGMPQVKGVEARSGGAVSDSPVGSANPFA